MKDNRSTYFTDIGHLSELAFAKVAESVAKDHLQDLPTELRAHLEDCSVCRHEVAELYQVVQTLDVKTIPTPAKTSKRTWLWVPVVLLLGALLYWYRPSPNTPTPIIETEVPIDNEIAPTPRDTIAPIAPAPPKQADEQPQAPKEETPVYADAEAFVPNEQLESLVGNQVRSGSTLRFLPELDQSLYPGEFLSFSWSNELEGPFTLLLLDNQEEEQNRYEGMAHNWAVQANLSPGLYYWKLETEEDLLFVGKFTILTP